MSFYAELEKFETELEKFSKYNSNAFNSPQVLNSIRNLFNSFSEKITLKKREIQLKDVDLFRDLTNLDILINFFDEKNNFEKVTLIRDLLIEVRKLKVLLK